MPIKKFQNLAIPGARRPAMNACSMKEPICSNSVWCLLSPLFPPTIYTFQTKRAAGLTAQPLFSLCILLFVPFIAHYNHNIFCSGQNGQFHFFECFYFCFVSCVEYLCRQVRYFRKTCYPIFAILVYVFIMHTH